jgi:putative hydrolase of the HAD superfamily
MTTVLVACGLTEHPQHQAIKSWTELPPHIHHKTDALDQFLAEIAESYDVPSAAQSPYAAFSSLQPYEFFNE